VITGVGSDEANRSDADVGTRRAVESMVLPTLRWALEESGTRDADVISSSLLALGKTAKEPADAARVLAALSKKDAPAMVREASAIATGLLRRSGAEDAFDGKALDAARTKLFEVLDDKAAPLRVRCFAALGLGLLGDQPTDPADAFARDGKLVVRGLWQRIEESHANDDLCVSLLVALSLQPREGVPGAVLEGLRAACLKGTIARHPAGRLSRAHAALALARLGDGASTGLMLGLARARSNDAALRRSAIAALAVMAPRLDPSLRALAAAGLADAAKSGDPDTAGLALASVGRLLRADLADGSAAVIERTDVVHALLQTSRGGTPVTRPFAALALALAAHPEGRALEVPAFLDLREKALTALRATAADDSEDPEVRGAFCVALGLLEDERAVATLVRTASPRGETASLRADACAGLGMLGVASPEVLDVLRRGVEDESNLALRREATRALGCLGDSSVIPVLLRELASATSDYVLARAAVALGAIRNPAAVGPVVAMAKGRSTRDLARAVAIATLGILGDLEPYPSLSRLGVDSNYLARTDALHEALSLL
jgi:hypothetical protein